MIEVVLRVVLHGWEHSFFSERKRTSFSKKLLQVSSDKVHSLKKKNNNNKKRASFPSCQSRSKRVEKEEREEGGGDGKQNQTS